MPRTVHIYFFFKYITEFIKNTAIKSIMADM